jgi:hypothetical protein
MLDFLLAHLVQVHVGTTEKPVERGVRLLFPPDVDEFGRLGSASPRFAAQSPASEKACVQDGDVLLPAKGFRLKATLATDELVGCVASSSFFILRPSDHAGIRSDYLAAYLNHPHGQQRLRAHIHTGATVPVLNKADLLATTISVPSHLLQMQLVELHDLHQQQIKMARDIAHHKELLYHQAFQAGLLQS